MSPSSLLKLPFCYFGNNVGKGNTLEPFQKSPQSLLRVEIWMKQWKSVIPESLLDWLVTLHRKTDPRDNVNWRTFSGSCPTKYLVNSSFIALLASVALILFFFPTDTALLELSESTDRALALLDSVPVLLTHLATNERKMNYTYAKSTETCFNR